MKYQSILTVAMTVSFSVGASAFAVELGNQLPPQNELIPEPAQAEEKKQADTQSRLPRPYDLPNTVTDFPAAEVREVPVARANAVVARRQRALAERHLAEYVREAETQFEESAALQEAEASKEVALANLELVRAKLLFDVKTDPEYVNYTKLRDDLTKKIAAENARETRNTRQVLAMAKVKLDYALRITAMEQAVLAGSDEYAQARRDAKAAGDRIKYMKKSFRRSLRTDPVLAQMREVLRQREIAHLAAEAYLDSVIRARNIAVNFSAYLHRDSLYLYSQNRYDYDYRPPYRRYGDQPRFGYQPYQTPTVRY